MYPPLKIPTRLHVSHPVDVEKVKKELRCSDQVEFRAPHTEVSASRHNRMNGAIESQPISMFAEYEEYPI